MWRAALPTMLSTSGFPPPGWGYWHPSPCQSLTRLPGGQECRGLSDLEVASLLLPVATRLVVWDTGVAPAQAWHMIALWNAQKSDGSQRTHAPLKLSPQQYASRSAPSAHVCAPPAVTAAHTQGTLGLFTRAGMVEKAKSTGDRPVPRRLQHIYKACITKQRRSKVWGTKQVVAATAPRSRIAGTARLHGKPAGPPMSPPEALFLCLQCQGFLRGLGAHPLPLLPKQRSIPEGASIPQPWTDPAVTAENTKVPAIRVGTYALRVDVPVPSRPKALAPQAHLQRTAGRLACCTPQHWPTPGRTSHWVGAP
jgi:hypothetical protein